MYTAISLGARCEVAYQIRRSGFGRTGYPFDWIVTSMDTVIALIKNRFGHFMDLKDLDPRPLRVINTRWNIDHLHDFVFEKGLLDFPEVKAKFDRRVARFLDLLDSPAKLVFIRSGATEGEMLELDAILRANYPLLDFKLVMVNKGPQWEKLFEKGRLSSYQLREFEPWYGEDDLWDRIFSDYQLKKQAVAAYPNLIEMLEKHTDIDKEIKVL